MTGRRSAAPTTVASKIMRLLMRGDAALLTSLVQQAALLVSGVGSAWLIGDSGRGQLAYGMTVGTVAGLVAAGGWSPAIALALARNWSEEPSVFRIIASVATRRAIAAVVFALVGVVPFVDELDGDLIPVACGAVASAVGTVALQILLGVWQGSGRSASANLMRSTMSVTYSAPIALFVVLHFAFDVEVSVAAVAWMWVASWALPTAFALTVLFRHSGPALRLDNADPRLLGRMRAYSRTSFLGSVSLYELLRADVLVGTLVLSTASLGQYVVASSFTGLMKALGQAMGVSMLSRAALASDGAQLARVLRRSATAILAAAVIAGIALWPMFHWVLPDEFSSSLPAALVLIAASAVSSIRRILVEYAKGAERPAGASMAEVAFAFGLVVPLVTGLLDRTALGLSLATLIGCVGALVVALVAARSASKFFVDLPPVGVGSTT